MKFNLIGVALAVAAFCNAVQADMKATDVGFKAPAVKGSSNLTNAETGAIFLDSTSNPGIFYGNSSTTAGSVNWVQLGGVATGTQTANLIYVGPASGSAAAPTFRAQVAADRPLSVVVKTTTYSVATTDDQVNCSGTSFTNSLPAATGSGRVIGFKKTDASFSNVFTIAANGGDTIDGSSTTTINTQYESLILVDAVSGAWSIRGRTYPKTPNIYTMIFGTTSGTTPSPASSATNVATWTRDGAYINIKYDYVTNSITGAVDSGASLLFSLPSGLTVDTSTQPVAQGSAPGSIFGGVVGAGTVGFVTGAVQIQSPVFLYDSTHLVVGSPQYLVGLGAYTLTNANLTYYSFSARIPIVGWN